jgi:hypothetical protein
MLHYLTILWGTVLVLSVLACAVVVVVQSGILLSWYECEYDCANRSEDPAWRKKLRIRILKYVGYLFLFCNILALAIATAG